MSDNRKGTHGPDEDFEINFGDFGADDVPGGPPTEDYGFEEMPDPSKAAAPVRARPPEPVDDFEDLDAGFGEDPEPVAAPPRRPEVRRAAEPVEDFGDDEDGIEAAPPVRAPLRGVSAAARPPVHDDGEPSFGDEDADGHDGFEAERGADEDDAQDAHEGSEEESEPRQKRNLAPMAIYAAGGVFALVAGLTGWNYVAKPMLGLDQPSVVQANRTVTPVGALPSSPPGGQPALPGMAAAPAASLPGAPTLPGSMASRPLPSPQPPRAQVGLANQDAAITPSRPAALDPEVAQRIAKLEDMVTSLREQSKQPAVPDLSGRVRQLEERLAAAETRNVPPAPRPEVQVPLKPQVIDGWSLQGVNRNTAWVKGPTGLVEAREGTDLPGAGRVTGIQRYNKDYIVVTNTGVIMREMRN